MGEGPTAEQLLADAEWLRRLALRLAGDEDEADDLVQESWIAAWRRQPDAERSLRPWLAKVARDLALMKRRAERRRGARDEAWERGREGTSPEQLLEQVRLHRLLVDLVLELEEPYRGTIIARFVEGRSAAELARAQGIPESTVRGRLRDGLARLRARLDERQGERRAWAPAVLAFAQGGMTVAKPAKTIAVLVALLALLAGAGIAWRALDSGRTDGVVEARSRPPVTPATTASPARLEAILAGGDPPCWIAQAGAPARRIAGRVLVDGAPAAGALVRVTSELSLAGLMPALEQRTGPDGRFDFGAQPAREVMVSAAMPGMLAVIRHVDLRDPTARPDALELALTACVASIHGRVLDPAGGPIAHARLLREDAVGAESDATGAYELCVTTTAAEPEQTVIVVRADGYGAVATAFAPSGRVRHDFVLTPEASIGGVAVTADGAPVANARIWAEPDDTRNRPEQHSARMVASTDEHGRFELTGLAGGRHRLGGIGQGLTAPPIVVAIGAGESRQVTVRMLAVGVVRGRVLRGAEPVAGARVAVAGDSPVASAVSQADGSFVLDGAPLGQVVLTAAPYRVRAPESVEIVAGDNQVTLQVESLGSLSGVVRHAGEPVPNARVSAHGPSKRSGYADASGRYRLDGLAPGDYSVTADDTRFEAYVDGVRVTLALAEARQLDLDLLSSGRISGVVVDPAGRPVADAHVRFLRDDQADEGRCNTNQAGRFECGWLAGGRYQATVFPLAAGSAPFAFVGPAPAPILVEPREARVDGVRLVVEPERRAIGGVVVTPAGNPIADARVLVSAEGPSMFSWMPAPSSVTTTDGAFRIEGLAPGRYTLLVRTLDGASVEHRGIEAGTLAARLVVEPPCLDAIRSEPAGIAQRPGSRIVWDDSVELIGWSIPSTTPLEQELEIAFYYKVLRPIDRSWRTFVHFDGAKLRLNADHQPLGGRCPMSSWQPGDYVIDRFTARFGPDYAPGDYTIWTGFFIGWAGSWLNMPVSTAPAELLGKGDRVRISVLSVEARP